MNRAIASIIFMAFLTQPPVAADEEEVLTNEDILIMTEEGISERVIVAKIMASETDFDISREQLVVLSRAGVTTAVLEAMVLESVPPSAHRPASAYADRVEGTPCTAPGLYLEEAEGAPAPIHHQVPQVRRGLDGFLPIGPRARAAIPGARSDTRTGNRTPIFWFCPEDSLLPPDTGTTVDPRELLLVVLKSNDNRKERSFEVGSTHVWIGRSTDIPSRVIRRVKFENMGFGAYRITPRSALDPGEYGFYRPTTITPMGLATPGHIFPFGVD